MRNRKPCLQEKLFTPMISKRPSLENRKDRTLYYKPDFRSFIQGMWTHPIKTSGSSMNRHPRGRQRKLWVIESPTTQRNLNAHVRHDSKLEGWF